ncbi:MAG: type VI secretion system baseplate subunit TssG [Gammaproteobacteria bacterium]|nr:type VI secretion system baseplate subunit TssG [Gammaproteobacteria bacterium]
METESRTPSHPVSAQAALGQMQDKPWEYDFFQALRRVDAAHPELPRLGRSVRISDDPVRLGQAPDCAFAPASLAGLHTDPASGKPRLEVLFFGLTGPNGPLPLHLTEYARDRQRNKGDLTLKRFFDVFHHRMLSLFYRAWAEARPTVSFDRPEDDDYASWVGALSGRGMASLRGHGPLHDDARRYYTGHLAANNRYAEGLAGILAEYFRLPVAIEEFVGHWLELPERSQLGRIGTRLGEDACIGRQVWDRQHKFRIRLGPLKLADYLHMLPRGEALPHLGAWVREYLGDELDWDLNLVLKAEEVPPLRLGGARSGEAGRLGWSSWLGNRREDAADLCLDAHYARHATPNHHSAATSGT